MILRIVFVGAILSVATAAYADCRPKFNFTAGRDSRGLVQNIAPGEACRIAIYRSAKGSNRAELKSAQLVSAPRQGAVAFEGTSAIFTPAARFSGRDSMTIRYNYVALDGRAMKSDVRFRLTN